jgi:hypothetical protein
LNIREGSIDGAKVCVHEGLNDAVHIDLTDDSEALLISILGALSGLGVFCFVIADGHPCGQATVELIESYDVAGTNFGFELILNGLEESFHKTAGLCKSLMLRR